VARDSTLNECPSIVKVPPRSGATIWWTRCDESGLEYWNAGVESFNTIQELEFYKRYNSEILPDHVVLTFHLNDFRTTPVAFISDAGDVVVYSTHKPVRRINKTLVEHSHLYRLWVGVTTDRDRAWEDTCREVAASLREFKEILEPTVAFTVLIFPILSHPDDWSEVENASYHKIVEILDDLEIRYLDLRPVMETALLSQVMVREQPDDPWHPSRAFAQMAARYLLDEGLCFAESYE
jgi:hypothetical protein